MIIAQISRYDTKERVLGNSWLLKLFMVPIQILFLTYFWRKRPIFDQNDLSKWWITEYGHVAKSKYQNIYCEYHAIIYQLPQTNPNFFQNTLTANSKSFLERKMANFTEKRCTCENWNVILKVIFEKIGFWNQSDHFYREWSILTMYIHQENFDILEDKILSNFGGR